MAIDTIADTDRLIDRIVILTTPSLKTRYLKMCGEKGVNPSEHARENWEAELKAHNAKK